MATHSKSNPAMLFPPFLVSLLTTLLGLAAVYVVVADLAGLPIPLVSGDKQAFIALAILGFAMCSIGMGNQVARYGWLHWTNLIGTLLGVLAAVLIVWMLLRGSAPYVPNFRIALGILAGIGLIKWVLTVVAKL